jgi:hypothetical protein
MQSGDVRRVTVQQEDGTRATWCLRLVKKAQHGAWLVEWLTGPLAGREARVGQEYMKP